MLRLLGSARARAPPRRSCRLQPVILEFLPAGFLDGNGSTTPAPLLSSTTPPLETASFAATPVFMCAFPGNQTRVLGADQCPFDASTQCIVVSNTTCNAILFGGAVVYVQSTIALAGNDTRFGAAVFADRMCSLPLLGADISARNLALGQCGPLTMSGAAGQGAIGYYAACPLCVNATNTGNNIVPTVFSAFRHTPQCGCVCLAAMHPAAPPRVHFAPCWCSASATPCWARSLL